jgi:RimJ/RimL family protein N-acetyltransferase
VDLTLRPWAEDDAPALSRAIAGSLEHLRPWLPWTAAEPLDVERRRAWIREVAAGADRVYGMWLDGRIVGGCGLHRRVGPGAIEIGYWVHPAFVRRGIATEAVRRLCAEAFGDPAVQRVEIHHDPANVASGRVAAAAGFAFVGEYPDEPEAPGEEGVESVWRLER